MMSRCPWAESSPLMIHYHDKEYGRSVTEDNQLFELLVLELNQAGLSWQTILNKRENFRAAFANFQVAKVAAFSKEDEALLLENEGIIRHRKKIQAAIVNAEKILDLQKEFGSFYLYLKKALGEIPPHGFTKPEEVPSETEDSKRLSQLLKKRGFQFVGSKVCYSFLQSAGFVNDHLTTCFCYEEIEKNRKTN